MSIKTNDEKEAMIKKLVASKETIPEVNMFGDNNHAIIDGQIDVLKGKLQSYDDVYNREHEYGELGVSDVADAIRWLDGEIEDADLLGEM